MEERGSSKERYSKDIPNGEDDWIPSFDGMTLVGGTCPLPQKIGYHEGVGGPTDSASQRIALQGVTVMEHFTKLTPEEFGTMKSTDGQKAVALFTGCYDISLCPAVQMMRKVVQYVDPNSGYSFYIFTLPMDPKGRPVNPLPVPTEIKTVPCVVVYDKGNPIKAFAGGYLNEPGLLRYFSPSRPGAEVHELKQPSHDRTRHRELSLV